MNRIFQISIAALALALPGIARAQVVGGTSLPGVIHLGTGVLGGIGGAGALTGGAIGGVGGVIGGAGGTLGGLAGSAGGTISGALGGVGGTVGAVGGAVGGTLGGLSGGAVGGTGSGLAGGALGGTIGSGTGGMLGSVSGATDQGGLGADPAATVGGSETSGLLSGMPVEQAAFAPIALPAALLPGKSACRPLRKARRRCPLASISTGNLKPSPGTPLKVVQLCRDTVVASALKYGVARVDAASAGVMGRSARGFDAPITFRILYDRRTGPEIRQATIDCRLDDAGRVVAAL